MKYITLLLGLSILLNGCGGGEDTKSPIEPQQKQDLTAANDILAQVKIKRSAIESAQEKVKEKADDARTLAGQIGTINLSDPSAVISSNESLQFNALQNIQADMQKSSSKVSAEKAELKELLRKALDEQKKQPDSLLLRKVVDEIRDEIDAALASTKTIHELSNTTANLNPSIKNELDRVIASIGKSSYDVIDGILTDIQSTSSLGELKNKISSVENQVRADSFVGGDITRLFDQEIPKDMQGDPAANLKGIKDKAQEKLAEVDQYFAGVAADDAALLEKAQKLDALLGNEVQKPLEKLANTKGFTPAEVVRKQKFKETVDPSATAGGPGIPPPPPSPPPPGGGGVPPPPPPPPGGAIKSLVQILKDVQTKIAAAKPGQVDSALDTLKNFYDDAHIAVLKAEATKAEDVNTYKPTKESLQKALEPFLPATILAKLNAAVNEDGFDQALSAYRIVLNKTLFANLEKSVADKRKERIDELKNHLMPQLNTIDTEVKKLDAVTTLAHVNTLEAVCNSLKPLLKGMPADCAAFKQNVLTDAATVPAGLSTIQAALHPISVVKDAKASLAGKFEQAVDQISGAKNFNQFQDALAELNQITVQQFDITTFPATKVYTLADLANQISTALNTFILVPAKPGQPALSYVAIATNYQNLVNALPAVHDDAEVQKVKDSFEIPPPGQPPRVGRLFLQALSEPASNPNGTSGREKIRQPFVTPKPHELLAKAREAALKGGGSTNLSPEDLLSEINNMDALNDETAINNLLDRVARDLAPALKQKIVDIKSLPAIRLTFAGQQAKLKDLVDKDSKYLALKNLASLDISDADAVKITGSAPSLEDFANKIPRGMRQDIFGKAAPSKIDVASKFEELRDNYVANAVNRIKYNTDPKATGAQTKATTQPIVNALTLLFGYQLDELTKLNFDGNDDAQVEKILTNMDSLELNRFNGFYTAVGEEELDDAGAPTGVKRPIISQLQALKAKLDVATSTNQMVIKLKTYIDAMML